VVLAARVCDVRHGRRHWRENPDTVDFKNNRYNLFVVAISVDSV